MVDRCPICSQAILGKSKRIRNAGAGSCLLELLGVLLVLGGLFALNPLIMLAGFVCLLLGHMNAYKTVEFYRCKHCKQDFDRATITAAKITNQQQRQPVPFIQKANLYFDETIVTLAKVITLIIVVVYIVYRAML